jgi:SAM-dependent methyltransferase
LNWAERNEAWEGRAKALGERAVLHVGHRTPEAQRVIFELQKSVILPLFEREVAPILAQEGLFPGTLTLDFGCGVGRWSHELARITGSAVLGIDPTRQFVEYCRERHSNPEGTPFVSFELYENGKINAGKFSFDVIFACMVLSTILDVDGGMFEATMYELGRVIREGGLFFLVDNTSGPPNRPIVRSPYSISRTVEEYVSAAKRYMGIELRVIGGYVDLGETNTIFAGRKA